MKLFTLFYTEENSIYHFFHQDVSESSFPICEQCIIRPCYLTDGLHNIRLQIWQPYFGLKAVKMTEANGQDENENFKHSLLKRD